VSLTRRALFGLVAGLPFALKAGAVEKPHVWPAPTFKGVPFLYEKAMEGPRLWHMSSVGDPTDWDRLPL